MTLERQLRWLDSHISLAKSGLPVAGKTDDLSLEPTRRLLALLGDPHLDAPAVHLTGTNGKGSTAHLVSLLLREHGLRVGTYASPHVSAFNERIQIDVAPIGDRDLAATLEVVRLAADQLDEPPSWFELVTATAFRAFSDAAVDVMVIEVGMLGRWDSTNVIDAKVNVITNVGYDHTDGAEGWRDAIAKEKAGIVAPGSTLVIGELDEDLHHWFHAEGPGAVLTMGQQFELMANELGVGGRVIDIRTPRDVYEAVLVSLHGRHQGINAGVAIAAAEAFLESPLERDHLDSAFSQALMRGRLEVLSNDPLIVIDGAHNVDGARTAAKTFGEAFHAYGRRLLIVGMMSEKDPIEMLEALQALNSDIVVVCSVDWPRAMPAAELAAAARSIGIEPEVAGSPAEAVELALSLSTEGDAILVAGSLYVAGGVRNRVLVEG